MQGESNIERGILRGYLFEIVILRLLENNGFELVSLNGQYDSSRMRETREGFIEIRGRGEWHQIDCPCNYTKSTPFTYPIRLIGEVKFYTKELQKKHIREFIGVIKDIQENYFTYDGRDVSSLTRRMVEVGAFFAANGFNQEAERLAYAHGIKTISYKNNYLVDRIKEYILTLEKDCLSVSCMKEGNWKAFREKFNAAVCNGDIDIGDETYIRGDYDQILYKLYDSCLHIKTSFIGTTNSCVFIHFVGDSDFPKELFEHTDRGTCKVFYSRIGQRIEYFWLEIVGDEFERRFYFTPPQGLKNYEIFSNELMLNEKERLFKVININIVINGISRSLVLELDTDWMNAIRKDYLNL